MLLIVILIGLYFGLNPKKTDAPPKTTVSPTTVPPKATVYPTTVPPRIYNGELVAGTMKVDDVVLIGAKIGERNQVIQVGFYIEELLNTNEGCWHIYSENEKWRALKDSRSSGITTSGITTIRLPAGIKATAYKNPSIATAIMCNNNYKIVDINPGETKEFEKGTVWAFSFSKVS